MCLRRLKHDTRILKVSGDVWLNRKRYNQTITYFLDFLLKFIISLFIKIFSETMKLTTSIPHTTDVVIDGTIGQETIFTYTWSSGSQSPNIVLTSPSGCMVRHPTGVSTCAASKEEDTALKTLRVEISGIAEVYILESIFFRKTWYFTFYSRVFGQAP